MKNKFKYIIGGVGNTTLLDKIAKSDIGLSLALQEPVKLKECHKTEEQKREEIYKKLRSGISKELFDEYLLIMEKKSKLSRSMRDKIVYKVKYYSRRGLLTKNEIEYLKL